ncbi:hypothetical protein B0H10DRAFT_1940255 [Mycena sp. CBHHK59/15]|nr:hypothetical protein B0H10DRAFT_1940255 [Mycena sp. CBHHK59/15]
MESLATAFSRLQANYKFQTANYALYIYDHLLTLSDEVDKIWTQPFTLASLLFYINRSLSYKSSLTLGLAFYETSWSISVTLSVIGISLTTILRCERYVKFPGAATLSLITIAECVPLPPGFSGCVLTGNNAWFGVFWAAPIVTDTCIFVLTLWRTIRYQSRHGKMNAMTILLRDGILYFLVIFSVNLLNCLIYFLSPPDLKALGASFSQIMTAIMISRLQLNLRHGSRSAPSTVLAPMRFGARSTSHAPTTLHGSTSTYIKGDSTFLSVGNLGNELQGTSFDELVEHSGPTEFELRDLNRV